MLYDYITSNDQGHLALEGCDVESLVQQFGSPLYVLSETRIRENCRRYQDAMKQYLPEGSKPLYAGKALCFRGIYPVIQEEGFGADVVSCGEIYTALSAGFPAKDMYFHGTNKTDQDIAYALEHEVGTFIVDNLNELHELNRQAKARNQKQDILLRLTVGIDPHTMEAINTGKVDSQFGVPIETGQAIGFVEEALACEQVNLLGFHSHIGSQIFESAPFEDQVDILIDFAAETKRELGYTPEYLNLGGGFAVRYQESDSVICIEENIRSIGEHLADRCRENGVALPKILMEPGRSIVGDAGVTLYRAGGVKEVNGYRNYVTVDGGMTDNLRYALYKAPYTVLNASRMDATKDYACSLVGRCCESGDRIAEDITLAKPERGDVIAVLTTGAYNYSMASNYNRIPRPALVMLREGEPFLSVRRETFEDLITREIAPMV